MHVIIFFMRTTIEIPEYLKVKLAKEAEERKLKGFSQIITEALESYFNNEKKVRLLKISKLKGSLSDKDYKESIKLLNEGRRNWKD